MRTILSYPPAAAGALPTSKLPSCRAFRVSGLDGKRLLARLTDEGGAVLGELLVADSAWIDLGDAGTGLWWLEALAGETAPSSVAVTYVPRSSSLEAGWMVPTAPLAPAGSRLEWIARYAVGATLARAAPFEFTNITAQRPAWARRYGLLAVGEDSNAGLANLPNKLQIKVTDSAGTSRTLGRWNTPSTQPSSRILLACFGYDPNTNTNADLALYTLGGSASLFVPFEPPEAFSFQWIQTSGDAVLTTNAINLFHWWSP